MKSDELNNEKPPYSRWQLIQYFLKLGTVGFGGPIALVGYMFRDLVERRKWISEEDYKEGLTLAELAPGPLAAQLAIYLGYVDYRVPGATLVGVAFVLPSFFMVVLLGWLYKMYGGLTWMQAVFYGIAPAIIGIIILQAYKLTAKTLSKNYLLWIIYGVSALFTVVTESEQIWLIIVSGIIVVCVESPSLRLKIEKWKNLMLFLPLSLDFNAARQIASREKVLGDIFIFFSKAGALVFGSGLAIVPFLYTGVVKEYHWLNDRQFLDAVAVAIITPGPVVITVGFIGFLIAGFKGAGLAALGTFLPCYLFTIIPAPYFKKYGKLPFIVSFVNGVTAAAIGAITGAVFVLGKRTVTDISTALLALAAVLILWKIKKIPEPLLILAAAVIGLALKYRTIF